jgi:hypothetical protein
MSALFRTVLGRGPILELATAPLDLIHNRRQTRLTAAIQNAYRQTVSISARPDTTSFTFAAAASNESTSRPHQRGLERKLQ